MSAAGFAATAIAYGPARMGFGLFLPEFRSSFEISTQTAGLISSLGFLGFFGGLLISQALTARDGPRLPVLSGLAVATLGTGIVAAAPNLPVLSAGILLAMSSAGFAWTPFNNAVHRSVSEQARPSALSSVSTGTSLGIAAAGAAGLTMSIWGVSWRMCWAAFMAAVALAFAANWVALREVAGTPGPGTAQRWRALLRRSTMPLLGIGLCYGITSAIYISFAADRIAQAGGVGSLPRNASGSLVFICYGVFGLCGLFTASTKAVTGLPWLLRLLMLASALSFALVAIWPTTWAGVVVSAALQGLYVMMMSAVLSFWSDRLFPSLPSQSFTAVLLAVAAGSVIGPVAAGTIADAFGSTSMFIGTAALAASAAAVFRSKHIRECPQAS
ncbi:MFS transporter [Afifella marina]|uniref:Predicted arabinose efflux permease, MFS family n=2 Tax=Afifella marina TaxID=1080 RepID=A0A1G5MDB7_AFIMA|nr:MFS transporter [Afifella marina]SCZ22874.1 Predicted arabinose efflux permease, MFS family [Afifella marina DSM 2698]